MRVLLLLLVVVWCETQAFASEKREETLGDWLAVNDARVIRFLRGLGPELRGSKVQGVRLTDRPRVLRGYTYLGQVPDAGRGAHVFLFSRGRRVVAYVWVDRGGSPLTLPRCPTGREDLEPATALSGDIYTWKKVQPDHSVVVFECRHKPAVLNEWVRRASADLSSE